MFSKKIVIISIIISFQIYGQNNIETSGSINATGLYSTSENLPLWFYTNTSSAIGEKSNFSSTAETQLKYNFKNSFIEVGTTLLYRDNVENDFQRRDLYIRYQNNWLKAILGAKRQDIEMEGLSISNKNFSWSLNTRPLPGLILEANNPIKISKTFALDWGIAHYNLNDTRYVQNTWVHYKRIGLFVNFPNESILTLRLQHFAQWAGTSPKYGDLQDDFQAFIDVFFARESDTNQGFTNELGNHLGSYYFEYEFSSDFGGFSFYYEHPFEDGSGTAFKNFPDGIWGINFVPLNNKYIKNFVYEYIGTTNQSGAYGVSGGDNYFSHNLYRNGWSYEGNIIGFPLIQFDKTLEITDITNPIISNRVKAHHFGINGSIKKIDWAFKTTIYKNFGRHSKPLIPVQENWSNYLSISYTINKFGKITLQTGLDFSNVADTLFGTGLSYSYIF